MNKLRSRLSFSCSDLPAVKGPFKKTKSVEMLPAVACMSFQRTNMHELKITNVTRFHAKNIVFKKLHLCTVHKHAAELFSCTFLCEYRCVCCVYIATTGSKLQGNNLTALMTRIYIRISEQNREETSHPRHPLCALFELLPSGYRFTF